MKKESKSRYEKILERKDRRHPPYLKQIMKDFAHIPLAMVVKMKLLIPDGSIEMTWSEKSANEMGRRKDKK